LNGISKFDRLDQLNITTEQFYQALINPVFFAQEIYHATGLVQFGEFTDIEIDMIEWSCGGPGYHNRRVLLAPRGIGKSHYCVCIPAMHDQYLSVGTGEKHLVYVPSKSEKVAQQNVATMRDWLENVWFLRHMKPNPLALHLGGPGHRDNKDGFDIAPHSHGRQAAVLSRGVEGQHEGTRAHAVRPDDIETKSNTRTVEARRWLAKMVREFTEIASYGRRDIVFTGTYNHEDSVYVQLQARNFTIRSYPLLFPTDEEREKIIGLAPIIAQKLDSGEARPGDKVFTNVSDSLVADKRAEGRTWFYMQNMLIPSTGDEQKYPLRLEDFIVFPPNKDKAPRTISWGKTNNRGHGTRIDSLEIECHGFEGDGLYRPIMWSDEWSKYSRTVMWIDPAGYGRDKLGRCIISHLNGYLFIRLCDGLTAGYQNSNLHKIARDAREHMVNEIRVEDVGLQGMMVPLLKPIVQGYFTNDGDNVWACTIEPEPKWATSVTKKETRIIDALEGPLNQHRLIIDPKVISNEDLQFQLTRITREPGCIGSPDELESLAACVWSFREEMAIDASQAAQQQEEEDIDGIIRQHMEQFGEHQSEGWIQDRHRPNQQPTPAPQTADDFRF